MYSSQNINKEVLFKLLKDNRTVFRLVDVAMLVEETSMQSLSKKLNYYVGKGQLQNPRKGIYTRQDFNPEELACRIYAPSYISLDYVLQNAGIIFQYHSQFTLVSYLSRTTQIGDQTYRFRKIKNSILANPFGIRRQSNGVNVASPERAFLDMLYLSPDFYFDNLNPLDKDLVNKILPMYQSKALNQMVTKLLQNGQH